VMGLVLVFSNSGNGCDCGLVSCEWSGGFENMSKSK